MATIQATFKMQAMAQRNLYSLKLLNLNQYPPSKKLVFLIKFV